MTSALTELLVWLGDPAHWRGSDGIPNRIEEHLVLTLTALAVAAVLALPLGLWLGHTGRGATLVVNTLNIGRALPSLAILALALPLVFWLGLGLGFWPTVVMLVPLGVPLILINSYAAIRAVDRDTVEAARGMGMSGRQILTGVELPLALPVILGGVRNAAVTIVATATLGAIVASGGLGRYVVDGLARQDQPRLLAGAVLVSSLAIVTEVAFAGVQRRLTPAGLREPPPADRAA